MPKKKKEKKSYEMVRKQTAPPTKKFKTRKGELPRKQKHKGNDNEVQHSFT